MTDLGLVPAVNRRSYIDHQLQIHDVSIQQLDRCLQTHIESYAPDNQASHDHAKAIISQHLERQRNYILEIEKRGTFNISDQQLQQPKTYTGSWRPTLGKVIYTLKTWIPGTLYHTSNSFGSQLLQSPNSTLLLPSPSLYFDCDLTILFDLINYTNDKHGISSHLLTSLQQHYGPNTLPRITKPRAWTLLYHQLTDLMVLILLVASIVEGAQSDFDSMAILLAVVVLNTVFGCTQEWKACQTLFAMMDDSEPKAKVIRDGNPSIIPSHQLVPGDLVLLTTGDLVPADLRLIETHQLEIVESILSGESNPVQKQVYPIYSKTRHIPLTECYGNAFMSTIVTHGHGKGVVVRTGTHTEIGKINTKLRNTSTRKVKTRIQLKLDSLGKCLVGLSILLCSLVVVIGIIWKRDTEKMINVGLSLAVSVIPEGLVAVTTVSMALGVQRMMKRQCIMRTLPAVETLGSVTAICTDKTGTLTEGIMKTTKLWTADNKLYDTKDLILHHPSQGHTTRAEDESDKTIITSSIKGDSLSSSTFSANDDNTGTPWAPKEDAGLTPLDYSMMICALCNNATIYFDPELHEWKSTGDPTDLALLSMVQHLQLGPNFWKRRHLHFDKHLEHAFDSTRKLMTIIYATSPLQLPLPLPLSSLETTSPNGSSQGSPLSSSTHSPTYTMVSKGAPEDILQRCTHYFSSPEVVTTINDKVIHMVMAQNTRLASKGQRVIGLAIKFIPRHHDLPKAPHTDVFLEEGMIFVGLIGLVDPPKQGAKEAIRIARKAGIQVIMITGDQAATATAVATQLGIDSDGSLKSLTGKELDELSIDELASLDPFPCVFGRVSHDNKLKIIHALQQRGEVVAMIGDGVNDATAIRQADIGIAMGSGTEITKQAADMILLDNDFLTIISAIEEGRHVFTNILKFTVYLLSCNGAEIILMLICVVLNMEMPLTTMMILWANIIADIPPAMALGVEPKEIGLMDRSPRQPNLDVLTWTSWLTIGLQALTISCLTLTVYLVSIHVLHHPLAQSQSAAFTTLTTLQLLHSFLSKSITQSIWRHGILTNQWLILAFGMSFSLMILGIYSPGISSWLQLTFVDAISWVMILACCFVQVILVESWKWCLRSYRWII
ncbi:hypothetical protein BC941DRAFT_469085 [Chlamydoabsidia padenii]|nr:hypothetical protein BC941DRAFT_469085 [Chlamydoabsidia padenii]